MFHNKNWRYGYSDKWYKCTLSYELVVKITKHFITHKKEHDNILYQMEAETEKMMYNISATPWGGNHRSSKWYNQYLNRKEKLAEERKIVDIEKAYKGVKNKSDLLDI